MKKNDESFSEFLEESGFRHEDLSKEQLLIYKGSFLGVEIFSWREGIVDEESARLIPEKLARKHRLLPVGQKESELLVATADPGDTKALQEVSIITGKRVKPLLATEEDLQIAIRSVLTVQRGAEQKNDPEWRTWPVGEKFGREEALAVRLTDSFFDQALRERSSDIHWEPGEQQFQIRFRIDGFLENRAELPQEAAEQVVNRLKVMAGMDVAERRIPQDGGLELLWAGKKVDVRVSTFPTIYGEKVVTRLLNKEMERLALEQLGMSRTVLDQVERLLARTQGMLLVCGPTGSGKTTTLYALLERIDRQKYNLVSVEDPVEYRLPGVNQGQVNTKAGWGFPQALRAVLRQDPDIIMVGEIRDRETAEIAVSAALTGHLVLSTLHTNSAAEALTRLLDMGIEPYLLAAALSGVLAQQLVRKLCPRCRLKEEESDWGFPGLTYKAAGCDDCRRTGYHGRIGIHEYLAYSEAVKRAVLQRKSSLELREIAQEEGMLFLWEDGLAKAQTGLTSLAEVWRTVGRRS